MAILLAVWIGMCFAVLCIFCGCCFNTPSFICIIVSPCSICSELKTREIQIDSTEYMFKFSLLHRRYGDALKIMQTHKLVGKAIIAYLHKKGFPEVALHFVQDPKTKVLRHLHLLGVGLCCQHYSHMRYVCYVLDSVFACIGMRQHQSGFGLREGVKPT